VAALVAANVIWGGSIAATEIVLVPIPPATLAFLRAAIACVVLWPLAVLTGVRPARGPLPALLGLTGVALFALCQNAGLGYASPATASMIQGAIPILTALLAAVILGERLGGRRLAGITVSLVGVTGLVLLDDGRGPGPVGFGDLLPLASALSFALFNVLGRRAFAGGVLPALAGASRYAVLALLPAAVAELALTGAAPPSVGELLLLLYLGVGCSALAFALAAFGLRQVAAGQAAIFGNLKPLIGIACAALLLGAPPSPAQGAAGALVLTGVWLATVPRSRKADRPDSGTCLPHLMVREALVPRPRAAARRSIVVGRPGANRVR
jgi:drug/metabolite transporter (DMT)-like permease